jgi:hypothetical protein
VYLNDVAGDIAHGPSRYRLPRQRMPFNSTKEGLTCVSVTWRVMSHMGLADIGCHVKTS